MTKNTSVTINLKDTITRLTLQQLIDYSNNGFLLIENIFLPKELDILSQAVSRSIADHKNNHKYLEGLILEKNRESIRTLNGLHLEYEIFAKLCCHPSLLMPAQQIINDNNLYVHQFKVNFKEAFTGDIWEWHQDYIYWLKGDGMPEPKAITIAILLDDVTEFNGPLMLVPGSHLEGTIDMPPQQEESIINQPSWMSNVTAKLKYPVPKELVTKLIKKGGLVAPKAPKGSILLFDCNTLHASSSNLSPFSRRVILITYNPITNVNLHFNNPRPNFLANKDYTSLSIAADDVLTTFGKI